MATIPPTSSSPLTIPPTWELDRARIPDQAPSSVGPNSCGFSAESGSSSDKGDTYVKGAACVLMMAFPQFAPAIAAVAALICGST